MKCPENLVLISFSQLNEEAEKARINLCLADESNIGVIKNDVFWKNFLKKAKKNFGLVVWL